MLGAEDVALENVRRDVMALPSQSTAEQAKQAVLEMAVERAKASTDAGWPEKSEALWRISGAIDDPAESMERQATNDATHIAAIKPVCFTTAIRISMTLWPMATRCLPRRSTMATANLSISMTRFFSPEIGEELRTLLWLCANPASPLRGNGELLKRLLRRAHAFIDAANLNADPKAKARTEIYDQFATEAGISGLVEFISLYPGLLLSSQRAEWDAGLQAVFAKLWPEMKRADNWNLNIETARMVAMLHLGYYFKNQEVVEKVLRHVDGTIAKMRPDGGFPYNGDSNPSTNYHGALIGSLSRIYDISGYEPLAKALAATQWKGPVMGRTDEFWTSPFHKTYRWNYERGTEYGNQLVLTLSRNRYANFLRG